MGLTKQQKADLARFGCTIESKRGLLCATWTGANKDQILTATILARVISVNCSTWPLLCLALEVSVARALPHFYHFPFNLRNSAHVNYLSGLSQTGKLHVEFLSGRKKVVRDHQLTPSQCARLQQMSVEGLQTLESCPKDRKFSDAVMEFESTAWIPQFFERAVPDDEFAKALDAIRENAEKIPSENRALARQLFRGFGDVLNKQFGEHIGKHSDMMLALRAGVLWLFDLKREFSGDYDRFVDFIADAIVVNMTEENLNNSKDWPAKLDSLINLFKRVGSAPQAEQEKVRAELMEAVKNTINALSSGRTLSFSMLQNLLLPLRPLLLGQPGRPTKDYSQEYQWKASGKTWTEVARQHLQESAETRTEFGGSDFGSLAPQEQENLRNRMREGVRSYAERTGKPFPLQQNELTSEPPQKIP